MAYNLLKSKAIILILFFFSYWIYTHQIRNWKSSFYFLYFIDNNIQTICICKCFIINNTHSKILLQFNFNFNKFIFETFVLILFLTMKFVYYLWIVPIVLVVAIPPSFFFFFVNSTVACKLIFDYLACGSRHVILASRVNQASSYSLEWIFEKNIGC